MVGAGAAGIAPGRHATETDVADAAALLSAGSEVVVLTEADLDTVTALSGSGPAYFLYLAEAMIAAAEAEGLSHDAALALTAATCRGTGKLMAESDLSPSELRARVTSKGGTTEAALSVLDGGGVSEIIRKAIRAVTERSRTLGKG